MIRVTFIIQNNTIALLTRIVTHLCPSSMNQGVRKPDSGLIWAIAWSTLTSLSIPLISIFYYIQ